MQHALKLSSFQLSGNELPVLKVILSLTNTDSFARWDYTEDTDKAAALLINTETAEGRELITDLAKSGNGQVLIAFTSQDDSYDDEMLALDKPLRSKNILPVLRQAAERFVSGQPNKIVVPNNISIPTAVSTPSISPVTKPKFEASSHAQRERERRVLDLLPSDPDKGLRVVDQSSRRFVVLDRGRNRYYVYDSAYADISGLLLKPSSDVSADELDRKELSREVARLIPHALDLFLWKAALAASQGRLFEGLSRDETFQLRRWPDLKRLGANPLHMKLTALLRRGSTIDYLAKFLNAPVAEIIDFINACYVLTYLDHQNKPTAPVEPPKKQLSESKRGLLSRIRNRLGI